MATKLTRPVSREADGYVVTLEPGDRRGQVVIREKGRRTRYALDVGKLYLYLVDRAKRLEAEERRLESGRKPRTRRFGRLW